MSSYQKTLLKDLVLKKVLQTSKNRHVLRPRKNHCLELCRAIISQQLSTKAAASIFDRFTSLLDQRRAIHNQIVELSVEQLRNIGLSKQKVNYLFHIASFFTNNAKQAKKIPTLPNIEVLSLLTQIKGVGEWTAQMFLLFTLGREDVFAPKDLGIQQAMLQLYPTLKTISNKKKLEATMENISRYWSPYRSYACLHLWEWKDKQKKIR